MDIVPVRLEQELVVDTKGSRWCKLCRLADPVASECGGSVIQRATAASLELQGRGLAPHRLVTISVAGSQLKRDTPSVACMRCGALSFLQLGGLRTKCEAPSARGKRATRRMELGLVPYASGRVRALITPVVL